VVSQLFNALAIREISQYLRFGIDPLTYGDFLDRLKLLKGFGFPADRVHKSNYKYFIRLAKDKRGRIKVVVP